MHFSLFEEEPLHLQLKDGWIMYDPCFLEPANCDQYLAYLTHVVPWEQQKVQMFGKWVDQPRLTAFYGDPGVSYTYSGLTWQVQAWPPPLAELRKVIEERCSKQFNSVLLNYYRDGQDSMGWHSDDEPSLGRNPLIASVSFGAERKFMLRHRQKKSSRQEIVLRHGSLLVMGGALQHHWQHQLPKSKKVREARINLTFRNIIL
jgi:alkylated DNA repair dioxygenase AlkB